MFLQANFSVMDEVAPTGEPTLLEESPVLQNCVALPQNNTLPKKVHRTLCIFFFFWGGGGGI